MLPETNTDKNFITVYHRSERLNLHLYLTDLKLTPRFDALYERV